MRRTRSITSLFTSTVLSAFVFTSCSLGISGDSKENTQITGCTFGPLQCYSTSFEHSNSGDTNFNTWADDDKVYQILNDTPLTWNDQPYGKGNSRNFSVNILPDDLTNGNGKLVNSMDIYGTQSQQYKDPDGVLRAWKTSGLICVDNVLYLIVSRQQYGFNTGDRQVAVNGSIIKSTDHGKTWYNHLGQKDTLPPKDSKSMFPGIRFANPYFIEHGKNGSGGPAKWKADQYIYAYASSDWGNGDWFTMGRVPKASIMDKTKWQYYKGPATKTGKEGLDDDNWTNDMSKATNVFYSKGRTNNCEVRYDPGIDKYLMLNYYYVDGNVGKNGTNPANTCWEFYYSDSPWGPWTKFYTQDTRPYGFYIPTVPSKWISKDGKTLRIVVSGNYSGPMLPFYSRTYALWYQDMYLDFNTADINDNDPNITYSGNWKYKSGQFGLYKSDKHSTDTANSYITYSFTGTTVKWIGTRAIDHGKADVYIDNVLQATVDTYNWNECKGQMLFSKTGLSDRSHTIKIVVSGKKNPDSTGYYQDIDRFVVDK